MGKNSQEKKNLEKIGKNLNPLGDPGPHFENHFVKELAWSLSISLHH